MKAFHITWAYPCFDSPSNIPWTRNANDKGRLPRMGARAVSPYSAGVSWWTIACSVAGAPGRGLDDGLSRSRRPWKVT